MSKKRHDQPPSVLIFSNDDKVVNQLTEHLAGAFSITVTSLPDSGTDAVKVDPAAAVVLIDWRGRPPAEILSVEGGGHSPVLVIDPPDAAAAMRAVEEGRLYAFVRSPWEPEELRLIVGKAAENHTLGRDLAEHRSIVDGLLENLPASIYFKDIDHRYVHVNRGMAKAHGKDGRDNVVGKTDFDIAPPDVAARRQAEDARIIETGRAESMLVSPLARPDGEIVWYETTKAPARRPDGSISGVVGISRDITTQVRAEKERDLLFDVIRTLFDAEGLNDAIASVLRLTCEHTDWCYGEAWHWVDNAAAMGLMAPYHAASDAYGKYRERSWDYVALKEGGLPRRVHDSGESEWIPDIAAVSAETFQRRDIALEAGLKAAFAVRVPGRRGTPIAVLVFFLSTVRPVDAYLTGMIEAVARHLGQYLESTRDEELLVEREAALTERVKELRCLNNVSAELWEVDQPLEQALDTLPELIRQGMQYPDETAVRIELSGVAYATRGYEFSAWHLNAPIRVSDKAAGAIDIFYTAEKPDRDIGPFLKEEQELIENLARFIGAAATRARTMQALGLTHARLTDAIRSLPLGFALFDSSNRLVAFNDSYRDDRPESLRETIRPGAELEDIWRGLAAAGFYSGTEPLADEDTATQVARRKELWENRPSRQELAFRDGTWREVMVLPTSEGGTMILRLDITERKRHEQALADSEQRFRSLIANAVQGFCVHKDFKPLYANRSLIKILGYPSEEAFLEIGDIRNIVYPADRENFVAIYETRLGIREGDAPSVYEVRLRNRDGTTIIAEIRAALIPWENDQVISMSVTDITEQRRSEQALIESNTRLDIAAAAAGIGAWDYDIATERIIGDRRMSDIFGISPADFDFDNDGLFRMVHEEDRDRVIAEGQAAVEGDGRISMEYRIVRPDGEIRHTRAEGLVIRDEAAGTPVRVVGVNTDVTERRETERQLQQAQKMEAVGQLTGGIAHDFNNLLTVIIGNIDMLSRRSEKAGDEKSLKWARNVGQAARRGADLTKRLLAFSRRQMLEPVMLDVNRSVGDMLDMIERVIGEQITLNAVLADSVGSIRADASQLESAVLNLAVNARDAMPEGGVLSIETDSVRVDGDDDPLSHELAPGRYIRISVTDTGCGMPPEVVEKIFEPFFTTKDTGKGTGLGLSMVFGFVKQSGGHVTIYSEPGQGTTVRLYFPRVRGDAPEDDDEPAPSAGNVSGATILMAEDDKRVREFAAGVLENLGCRVIEAASGREALEMLRLHPDIDLLFTDIVMPGGMTGIDLGRHARVIRPGLPVLYTSGYAEQALRESGSVDLDSHWLPKPYTAASLTPKIAIALAGKADVNG
ncbi:MAG: PAS domain S-box protein [Alphaproteobacteria bacterium]